MAMKRKQQKQITKQCNSKPNKRKSQIMAIKSKPRICPKQQKHARPLSIEETVAMINGKTFVSMDAQQGNKKATKMSKDSVNKERKEPLKKKLRSLPERKPQGGTKPKNPPEVRSDLSVRKPIDTRLTKLVKAVKKPQLEMKVPLAARIPIIDFISTEEFYRLDSLSIRPRKPHFTDNKAIRKY